MRECIYCGRQLEKGEKCTCAMSVAKRQEREAQAADRKTEESKGHKTDAREARKREKAREKEARRRTKEQAKQARKSRYNTYKAENRNAFANVWRLFREFLRSPIETVMNPGDMRISEIIIFVIIEGIISGLCVYSIITGASRGPLRLLGNLLGFKGIAGYGVVLGWLSAALSGAVSGIAAFYLYSGVFYFVNKWVFKMFTPFRDFSKRFAFVALPTTIIGSVGVLLGFFSQTTFAVLLICGIVGTIVLTYEILRSMWYSKSPVKTMYTMMLCVFIFLLIALYVIRISVI